MSSFRFTTISAAAGFFPMSISSCGRSFDARNFLAARQSGHYDVV
jgi:hypothetical protein